MTRLICIVFMLFSMNACIDIKEEFTGLPPGTWRAELRLGPNPYPVYDEDAVREKRVAVFEGVQEDVLPFLMEIQYPRKDSFSITFINGEERIEIEEYRFGIDRRTAHDTLRIEFPAYNSYIEAEFVEEVLQGNFIKRDRKNYKIPFVAKHGVDYRFKDQLNEPQIQVDGKWKVQFQTPDGDSWDAIGEFTQDSSQLLGTFLTETGDYRFLAGNVVENEIWLSTFDGTHAFLFGARSEGPDSLQGFFKSGTHFYATWTAKRDEGFQLTDPDSLTIVKDLGLIKTLEGHDPSSGQIKSISDPEYKDKALILSVMGTWCPNCRDEVNFLKDWMAEEQAEDIEVIGLAFERPSDTSQAYQVIERYKRLMDIPYEIWYMGTSGKQAASERLPMLNRVISYPTMIFLNQEREVIRVHTGFAGPATSEYEEFKRSFEQTINQLR